MTDRIKEGDLSFTRYFCTDGFIDSWSGDAAVDPNNPSFKPNYQLNSIVSMWRLNGKGEWIRNSTMWSILTEFQNHNTSDEIWDYVFNIEK